MSRVIKFRAWGPNCKVMWDWEDVKGIASNLGWENFTEGERVLMQFTGLQDKNGVEIYEGDLVLVRDTRICEVIFHKHGGCWDLKLVNVLSSESIGSVSPSSYKYHVEVIGNIYENPDLLTK